MKKRKRRENVTLGRDEDKQIARPSRRTLKIPETRAAASLTSRAAALLKRRVCPSHAGAGPLFTRVTRVPVTAAQNRLLPVPPSPPIPLSPLSSPIPLLLPSLSSSPSFIPLSLSPPFSPEAENQEQRARRSQRLSCRLLLHACIAADSSTPLHRAQIASLASECAFFLCLFVFLVLVISERRKQHHRWS